MLFREAKLEFSGVQLETDGDLQNLILEVGPGQINIESHASHASYFQRTTNIQLSMNHFNLKIEKAPKTLLDFIDKVIFNDPTTIIFWKDGSKTVVQTQDGESFDKEKGLMAAILKKMTNNTGAFNKTLKKWCD